ncbi:hypothetical protein B0H13DRAFT_2153083 [Mycena leptocephala]|nr:hypothetical protein B0H13DRAFT_2153083 [Mycena leptocephala]
MTRSAVFPSTLLSSYPSLCPPRFPSPASPFSHTFSFVSFPAAADSDSDSSLRPQIQIYPRRLSVHLLHFTNPTIMNVTSRIRPSHPSPYHLRIHSSTQSISPHLAQHTLPTLSTTPRAPIRQRSAPMDEDLPPLPDADGDEMDVESGEGGGSAEHGQRLSEELGGATLAGKRKR